MTGLSDFVRDRLHAPVDPLIGAAARVIARRMNGMAVLFYGSVLRTGDIDGVLDFYVLTGESAASPGLQRLGSRLLWPDVSYHEVTLGDRVIRAKVATMPLAIFAQAADGRMLDTTIWARFVQPSALIWSVDTGVADRVAAAVAAAARTAARYAAVLGPIHGTTRDYWQALFRETYQTELRVEKPGREDQILGFAPDHFDRLLTLAWEADGLPYHRDGARLVPRVPEVEARALVEQWYDRRRAGKPLNAARLIKAAFTFEGAARYALWKIQRHTGIFMPVTPFRERHPILAAPGILWRVWLTTAFR
ncbi:MULTISPECIES: hypothetical protein [unclassified Sphingomonas]|uniref:hypothetical protein n=1 Tax=unclassified Sphingomonas TaxID=196159 RepID=UPI000835D3AA|nr:MULTISPECIES: hypothetical protein [unclassified Sphingomonas]